MDQTLNVGNAFQAINPSSDGLIQSIEDARSLTQLSGVFSAFPRDFGFDHALLFIIDEGRRFLLQKRMMTSLPTSHRESLIAGNFARLGHLVDWIRESKHTNSVLDRGISTKISHELRAKFPPEPHFNSVVVKLESSSGRLATLLLFSSKDEPSIHATYEAASGDIPVSYTHLTLPTTPYV